MIIVMIVVMSVDLIVHMIYIINCGMLWDPVFHLLCYFVCLAAHLLLLLKAAAAQTAKTHPNGIDYLINNAGIEGALHILEAYVLYLHRVFPLCVTILFFIFLMLVPHVY